MTESLQRQEPVRRLHSLTSLRFFAAAAVALMHGFGRYQLPVVDLGFVGVSFFFMLSGFVLTWAHTAVKGPIVFLRDRFAKLFPLSAVTLAVAAFVPVAPNSSPVSFLQSFTFTQAWWPQAALSFNPVAWSLSAEAFFYLLLPALVSVMRRFSTRQLVGSIVFLAVLQPVVGLVLQLTIGVNVSAFVAHFLTYYFPPYRLPEFIIGIALALLLKAGYRPSRACQLAAAATITAGVALVLVADVFYMALSWVSSALLLPAILVLIWTSARRELAGASRLLTNPRLVQLGDRSFSFYMVHYLVLGFVGLLVGEGAQTLPWWIVPPTLIAAAGIAAFAYRFVEKPCERLIRDLLSRKPALPPAPVNAKEASSSPVRTE